jgi:hypothetical protein
MLLAASAFALASCDQVELARLYLGNSYTDAEARRPLPLTLPLKEVDGWMIVDAKVNGKAPVGFVLDTGASVVALIDSERTRHLGLDMRNVRRLGSADDLAAPTGARQEGLDIDFGGLVLKDQTALAIPAASLGCKDEARKAPFDGVIGHDLFRRYTVVVDRDAGTVTFHEPKRYKYEGTGTIVPAPLSSRQPFVDAKIAPAKTSTFVRLHVDTGAGIDVTLFPGTSPAIKAPESGPVRSACFVGGKANYRIGAPIGVGLGGRTTITPVEYALDGEVVASGQQGRIGAKFLARYNLVIDYARERIILEPRRGQLMYSDPRT